MTKTDTTEVQYIYRTFNGRLTKIRKADRKQKSKRYYRVLTPILELPQME